MRGTPASRSAGEVYSPDEIARAARVPLADVIAVLNRASVPNIQSFVREADAVQVVRAFRQHAANRQRRTRDPLTLLTERKRRGGLSLVASGLAHGLMVAMIVLITSLGWLEATDTEQSIKDTTPAHLVYLVSIGPGGGGGGGGLKAPIPAPRIERKPPVRIPKKVNSPVPPVRKAPPPPPRPVITPPVRPHALPIETPKPAPPPPQVVQAPVVPAPNDRTETVGTLADSRAATPSNGPGTGGGAGTGTGTGMGEGSGSGIGPGSGGGTGGGPFRPGTGIDAPVLLREVKPGYTEEARRRAIEGDVVLEIVVRRDGSVGNLRVVRSLGAGLDQKAIEAVRQWRFGPARRMGSPVDVEVEVSVEFKMR